MWLALPYGITMRITSTLLHDTPALFAGAPTASTDCLHSIEWEGCVFSRRATVDLNAAVSLGLTRNVQIAKPHVTEPKWAWPLKWCTSHLHLIYIQVWAAMNALTSTIHGAFQSTHQMTVVTPVRTKGCVTNTDVPAQWHQEQNLILIPTLFCVTWPLFSSVSFAEAFKAYFAILVYK